MLKWIKFLYLIGILLCDSEFVIKTLYLYSFSAFSLVIYFPIATSFIILLYSTVAYVLNNVRYVLYSTYICIFLIISSLITAVKFSLFSTQLWVQGHSTGAHSQFLWWYTSSCLAKHCDGSGSGGVINRPNNESRSLLPIYQRANKMFVNAFKTKYIIFRTQKLKTNQPPWNLMLCTTVMKLANPKIQLWYLLSKEFLP